MYAHQDSDEETPNSMHRGQQVWLVTFRGEMHAELTGLSVWKVFKWRKFSTSNSLAELSLEAVMIAVISLLYWRSLMLAACCLTDFSSSPVLASHFFIVPFSCPVMIVSSTGPHTADVI